MTNNEVRAFFNSHLATLNLPNLTVEGARFEPKADDNFVRTKLYPNETSDGPLGRKKSRLAGLFQMDIFVNLVDGVDEAHRLADLIVDAFPLGSAPLSNSAVVIFAVWQEGMREEPGLLHIPVVIRYEAFT